MAVIKVNTFGGLLPSVSARALPPENAQTATNLLARTTEFRPLALDNQVVSASGVSGPTTLHRLQRTSGGAFNTTMTTGWIVSASDINYVKAPLADSTTEKTLYSYNDGSTPPRQLTAAGADWPLGVPAPTTAPTVSLNAVAQFSTADRDMALANIKKSVTDAITAQMSAGSWYNGAGAPSNGYIDGANAALFSGLTANPQNNMRMIRASSVNGAYNGNFNAASGADSYVSGVAPDNNFNWMLDPQLQGFWTTTTASTNATYSWAGHATGNSKDHFVITFPARGFYYTINTTALNTALAAIPQPNGKLADGTARTYLFDSTDCTNIINRVNAYISATGDQAKPKFDALVSKLWEVKTLLDGGPTSLKAALMAAFYAKSDVSASITNAKANFANAVFDTAYSVFRSSAAVDTFGPNGVPPGEAGS